MKGGEPNKPEREPDIANLDQSELVSNQAVTVIPWMAGKRLLAVTWVSPVYNLRHKDGHQTGKK